MKVQTRLVIAVCSVVLALPLEASAQNFFWSLQGFEQGAVNSDLTVNTNANPAGTVFLYYFDNGQSITEGFHFDFFWDNDGVVAFTAAETFEADILLDIGTDLVDLDDRWGDFSGPASDVTPNFVEGFLTVNVVGGTGIQPTNVPGVLDSLGLDFVDSLYDTTASAFLVGSIDYKTVSDGKTSLQRSGGYYVYASFNDLIFTGVPEPTSTFCLIITALLAVRRKERPNRFVVGKVAHLSPI